MNGSGYAGPSQTKQMQSSKGKEKEVELQTVNIAVSQLFELLDKCHDEQLAFKDFAIAVYMYSGPELFKMIRDEVASRSGTSRALLEEMLKKLEVQATVDDANDGALCANMELAMPSNTPPAANIFSDSMSEQRRVSPAALSVINETARKRSASAGSKNAGILANGIQPSPKRTRHSSYSSMLYEQAEEENVRLQASLAAGENSGEMREAATILFDMHGPAEREPGSPPLMDWDDETASESGVDDGSEYEYGQ